MPISDPTVTPQPPAPAPPPPHPAFKKNAGIQPLFSKAGRANLWFTGTLGLRWTPEHPHGSTHMFIWNRVCEQGDPQDGEKTDGEEDDGKVEVVHAADDPRAPAVCRAAPGPVGKLGHHAAEANQKSTSQPPEGTLPKKEPRESPGRKTGNETSHPQPRLLTSLNWSAKLSITRASHALQKHSLSTARR